MQKAKFLMLNIDSDRNNKQNRWLFCRKRATNFLSASNSCYDVYVLRTFKKYPQLQQTLFSKSGKPVLDLNPISRCMQFSNMAACVVCTSSLWVKMNLFLPFGQQSHLQGYFAAWETFFLHGETLISQALPLHGHWGLNFCWNGILDDL